MDRSNDSADATRSVPVPDDAEFYREQDGDPPATPISPVAAHAGDIVLLPDRRAGTYLGAGRVLREGGEWAQFACTIADSKNEIRRVPAQSLDPLAVQPYDGKRAT